MVCLCCWRLEAAASCVAPVGHAKCQVRTLGVAETGNTTSSRRLNAGDSHPAKLLSVCPKQDSKQLKLLFKSSLLIQVEELGSGRETVSL